MVSHYNNRKKKERNQAVDFMVLSTKLHVAIVYEWLKKNREQRKDRNRERRNKKLTHSTHRCCLVPYTFQFFSSFMIMLAACIAVDQVPRQIIVDKTRILLKNIISSSTLCMSSFCREEATVQGKIIKVDFTWNLG